MIIWNGRFLSHSPGPAHRRVAEVSLIGPAELINIGIARLLGHHAGGKLLLQKVPGMLHPQLLHILGGRNFIFS